MNGTQKLKIRCIGLLIFHNSKSNQCLVKEKERQTIPIAYNTKKTLHH